MNPKMLAIERDNLNTQSIDRSNMDELNAKMNATSIDASQSVDVVDYAYTKVVHDRHRTIDDKSDKRSHPLLVAANQQTTQTPTTNEKPIGNMWSTSIDRSIAKFQFHRKKSEPNCLTKERPKFVRCSSIARLFGNTYSTQQSLDQLKLKQQNKDDTTQSSPSSTTTTTTTTTITKPTNLTTKCRPTKCERFKKRTEHQIDNIVTGTIDRRTTQHTIDSKDFTADDKVLSSRTLRSLSKSLGRFWRRSHSVEISPPDPEYKVLYLGNVLTGWAKGKFRINFEIEKKYRKNVGKEKRLNWFNE